MLDKSIPYRSFIMAISPDAVKRVHPVALPEGFSFRLFKEGDEKNWARIETSVLEFETEKKAEEYFAETYLPYPDDLKKRCVFVVSPDNAPVATTTAWCDFPGQPDTGDAVLSWVSADPAFQGKKLGKAVVAKALSLFPDLHPGKEVFLHTQTWSHRAVWLYHSLGFRLCRKRTILRSSAPAQTYVNEYDEGIEVLKEVMDSKKVSELVASSIE